MMIGQLAASTGLSVRTLRFYADSGVFPGLLHPVADKIRLVHRSYVMTLRLSRRRPGWRSWVCSRTRTS
jgi:hypothetical protein